MGFYDDPAMSDPAQLGKYRERFEISETPSGTQLKLHSGPVSKQDSMEHGALWDDALGRIKKLMD